MSNSGEMVVCGMELIAKMVLFLCGKRNMRLPLFFYTEAQKKVEYEYCGTT
jgi:hypothetical protein